MSREIDLIGGFYRDEPWSAQDTVNWLPVQAQSEGTRSPMKLRGVPGLRAITPTPDFSILGDYSLLHFDGGITDTGTVPQIWTAQQDSNGGTLPVVSTAQSRFGGASAFFDASTTTLFTSGFYRSNAFNLGISNFTQEAWIYRTANNNIENVNPLIGFRAGGQPSGLWMGAGTNNAFLMVNGSFFGTVFAIPLNTWTHVVFQRRGNEWALFVNGVLTRSGTSAYNPGSSVTFEIGTRYRGHVDEHRITFGRAVYPTAGFTPPDQPFQDAPDL